MNEMSGVVRSTYLFLTKKVNLFKQLACCLLLDTQFFFSSHSDIIRTDDGLLRWLDL